MAPPPHVNTPLSLDITASTHAPFGHSVDSFAASQADAWDCKVLSSWNGLVGYVTHEVSSTSAVLRRIAPKLLRHSPAWGIENGLRLSDVTFGEDACQVRSLRIQNTIWHCYVALPSMRSEPAQANKASGRKSKRAADGALCCRCWQPHLPNRANPLPSIILRCAPG